MKIRRMLLFSAVVAVVVLIALPVAASTGKTLDNLQAAFNGESNANAKYLEYAKKADEEGYKGVAALFRAAAKAEEIHAANHAEVIKAMGAVPQKKIELPAIVTTADNLKDAIKGETYERDTMYPDFLKVAREEKQSQAIRTFNFALQAEAEHANLYTKASKNQDAMKEAKDFYVCSICGYTTTKIDFERCPGCLQPKDKYIKVV